MSLICDLRFFRKKRTFIKNPCYHYLYGEGHDIFSSIPGLPPVTQKRHHDLLVLYDIFICT